MRHMNTQLPPLISIVGPTGIGKTQLAIELAQRLDGEIVNADSRQIYRYMNIGTAKPTPQELAAAPHHLIDIVDPDEPFSLAVYQQLATHAVADLAARKKLPLLVGGTGQYVAAVIEGWSVPQVPPQPKIRAAFEAEAAATSSAALHEKLRAIDPEAAAKIEPNNLRRIVRALEVYQMTGVPISVQQTRQPPPYRMTTVWLTMDRQALYARIDARVDGMIAAGLVAEVAALRARGYGWQLPAMSSLGYKEFEPYFEADVALDDCIERLKFNTHNFVRKQDMWFRRLPHAIKLDATAPDLLEQAVEAINTATSS